MLGEMEIINAVSGFLKEKDYAIKGKVSKTTDHGPDLEAISPIDSTMISIEAKGETSSNPNSKRHGLEFNKNQISSHVGRALLKSMQVISQRKCKIVAGMAYPENHRELISTIKTALDMLNIVVFLVDQNYSVDVFIGELPD